MAKEWCVDTGVSNSTASTASDTIRLEIRIVPCVIAPPLLEDISDRGGKVVLRLVPPGLEILLPVLCPRPAVVVDVARVRAGQLFGSAIGVLNVAQAFDERVTTIGIVRRRHSAEAVRCADRSDEGVRIVEDRFVIE